MSLEIVETPTCKSIALQFLLAHAERPHLLKSVRNPQIRKFGDLDPFYQEFVGAVEDKLPKYTEEKLLDTTYHMPQADYVKILDVFKEISGIRNPIHYTALGRIIPSIGDALIQLASMAGGPEMVIRNSPRFNNDFNNDQQIVIESRKRQGDDIFATVQHYFLPRKPDDPHYLEMVSAALGYWEGIPLLFGWSEFGETNLRDIQIPLDELVSRDFAYLGLDYQEKGGDILINGDRVGKKISLDGSLQDCLGYIPSFTFIREVETYHPVEIMEDVIIDKDLIFPKGTRYGMPCNRYDLKIPHFSFLRRMNYVIKHAWRAVTKKDNEGYNVLVRRPQEVLLSETMFSAQDAHQKRLESQLDAERTRADVAEARLQIDEQTKEVNDVFGKFETLAHDNKNFALAVVSSSLDLLDKTVGTYFPEYYSNNPQFSRNEECFEAVKGLLGLDIHPEIKKVAEYVKEILPKMDSLIENEILLMKGDIPVNKEWNLYSPMISPIADTMKRMYPAVSFNYNIPEEAKAYCDRRLMNAALTNLVSNAVEASLPSGEVTLQAVQKKRGGRIWTITDIYQSGPLYNDIAQKLNEGVKFTAGKEKGNGVGAAASLSIITKTHSGKIVYYAKNEDGGRINIRF